MNYPSQEIEAEIVRHETGLENKDCQLLVKIANATRNLRPKIPEGACTRSLIISGNLIKGGNVSLRTAYTAGILNILTDDPDMRKAIDDVVQNYLPK